MAMGAMVIPAWALQRPSSNAPDEGYLQDRYFLAFDDTTQETCYSPKLQCPTAYGGGTLTAYLHGIFASETDVTDEAVMSVSVEAFTAADAVDLDATTSFDTENTCEIDPASTAGYLCVGTCTLTNKDSIAAGDTFRLRIRRNPSDAADTCTGDFRLLSVRIEES